MTDGTAVLDIRGHWISEAAELAGPFWATREFVIEDARWQVSFRAYVDQRATRALFTLDVGGVYVIGGWSTVVIGAHTAIFPATHRDVICHSEEGAALFAQAGASIAVGERRSLIDDGLGFVPSLMAAMGEYDLVAMTGDRLFFGDRAGDLTKTRPTRLASEPLVRLAAGSSSTST